MSCVMCCYVGCIVLQLAFCFLFFLSIGLLPWLKFFGISGQVFGLISSFLSNKRLLIVLDGESLQEYPVNAGVPQGCILGPTLFLLYTSNISDDVICNIALVTGGITLYSKCDQASDLWQQLELASELETDLGWGRNPVGIYLLKVNIRNTRRCKIC